MAKIAFLGLGAMGSRMAASLIAAGHELTVWNRDTAKSSPLAEKRAKTSASPREAAADAEFIIAMLRDDEASRHVWMDQDTGALAGMAPAAIAMECSTLSLDWTRELARHCELRNQPFVDAPLAGSRPQAEARQLIFMAGGDPEVLAKAEAPLLAMGEAVHHTGPTGSGMVLKLAVNTLFGIQVAAAGELVAMLRRQGLDPARAVEIIGATPVCSAAVKVAAGMMLADAFAPMFPIELVAKDFGYALDAAGSAGMAPMIAAAKEVYSHAMTRGLGGDHLTSIVQLYREGSGA